MLECSRMYENITWTEPHLAKQIHHPILQNAVSEVLYSIVENLTPFAGKVNNAERHVYTTSPYDHIDTLRRLASQQWGIHILTPTEPPLHHDILLLAFPQENKFGQWRRLFLDTVPTNKEHVLYLQSGIYQMNSHEKVEKVKRHGLMTRITRKRDQPKAVIECTPLLIANLQWHEVGEIPYGDFTIFSVAIQETAKYLRRMNIVRNPQTSDTIAL